MGKASRWFRNLLGLKKSDTNPNPAQRSPAKKKWSFAKPHSGKDLRRSGTTAVSLNDDGASRHAIAVAAATAAVADAAIVAAQAAAAVVKLTNSGGKASASRIFGFSDPAACVSQNGAGYGRREDRAAVTIQSHFRAYLARRALRALKALVKLQALVKGYICRKQFAEYLQQMQAIARAQARARAGRASNSECSNSSTKSSNFNQNSPATPEKFEHTYNSKTTTRQQRLMNLKRNSIKSHGNIIYDMEKSQSIRSHRVSQRTNDRSWEQTEDEKSDKILEMDPAKPHIINSGYYCQTFSTPDPFSGEVESLNRLKSPRDHVEESNHYLCTADSSPRYCSSSSKDRADRAPNHVDHPSYMAYTESSKAKVRSVSAPKQRPQCERSCLSVNGKNTVHEQPRLSNNGQKVSALHASFTSKDYPGSGRLDRLGMPVRDVSGFSGGHWHRY